MELGEFVKESVKQLIDGVTEAQKYATGIIVTLQNGFLLTFVITSW